MTDTVDNNNTSILIPYPKTRSFKDIVHDIKKLHKDDLTFPIIEYTGKVKIHGTSAGISFNKDGSFHCQSRNKVITPFDDNYGFATWAYKNIETIKQTLNIAPGWVIDSMQHNNNITVYGEFAGQGVQQGVAVSQLPKMFIIFAIRYDMTGIEKWRGPDATWQFNNLEKYNNPDINLYNVDLFPTYKVTIDFNNPHLVQNQLVELTEAVEDECPVGKYFGVSGCGEGIVMTCHDSQHDPKLYNIKSKGEKHVSTKVKTIGVVNIEAIEEINKLVEYLLYHNQLESRPAQAIRTLKEQGLAMETMQDTPALINWIRKDIADENMQEILDSGIGVGKVMSACINSAKLYYKNYLDTLI